MAIESLSVVIPSHRGIYLEDTLNSLQDQIDPNFQLVLIENGTLVRKQTELVRRYFRSFKNFTYLHVKNSGLNCARNIGLRNSKSRIIAFTDDDCVPAKDWTARIKEVHSNIKEPLIGGKVKLRFIKDRPRWLEGIFQEYLAALDWGEKTRSIDQYEWLVGANMSFKSEIFSQIGYFDEGIGLDQHYNRYNDELELFERIKNKGFSLIYSPDPVIIHQIPENRTTIEYMESRAKSQGRSDVLVRLRKGVQRKDLLDFFEDQIYGQEWSFQQLRRSLLSIDVRYLTIFREYFLKARLAYLNGVHEAIVSQDTK